MLVDFEDDMSSKKRQIVVRLDAETSKRFDSLLASLAKSMGTRITQSQLVAMALKALSDKHAVKP